MVLIIVLYEATNWKHISTLYSPFFVMMSQLIINFITYFDIKVNPSDTYSFHYDLEDTLYKHLQN